MVGEQSLFITVPPGTAAEAAEALRRDPFWLSVVPAATTILAMFPAGREEEARRRFRRGLVPDPINRRTRTIEIPAVYGGEYGPDLPLVAAEWGCKLEEAVERHLAAMHEVLFLGFLPGFPYLESGHPPVPRLATPRLRVAAGSIGVAGTRTGIYPRESPGGWNIIGRTPAILFHPDREPPAALAPGDSIRFLAIPADRWTEHLSFPEPV